MTTNRTTTTTKNAIIMILAALALMLAPTALAADPVTIGMAGNIQYDGTAFFVTAGTFTEYSGPDYLPAVNPTNYSWSVNADFDGIDTFSGPIEVCAVATANCEMVGTLDITITPGLGTTTISGEVTPIFPEEVPTLPPELSALYGPFTFSETINYIVVPGISMPPVPVYTLAETFTESIPDPSRVAVDDDWSTNTVGDLIDDQYLIGYNAFSTVQAGVDAVAEAGTVGVFDGTYVENVETTKALTLADATPALTGGSRIVGSPAVTGAMVGLAGVETYDSFYAFTNTDDFVEGHLRTMTITVSGVESNNPAYGAILLQYKATLLNGDDEPVSGQTIYYPDIGDDAANRSTWSNFSTDASGEALFGPASGFTLGMLPALSTETGVTTPFAADLPAGDYTLLVELVGPGGQLYGTSGEQSLSSASAVTGVSFAFEGFDAFEPDTEHTVEITATASDDSVPDDLPLRYQFQLLNSSYEAVQGQTIYYPDLGDDPLDRSTWSYIETRPDGFAYFGPESGFTAAMAGLRDGATTPFATTLTEGSYELIVTLLDWSDPTAPQELGDDKVVFDVTASAATIEIPPPFPQNGRVVFQCYANFEADSYSWEFGDGNASVTSESSAQHTYATNGTYEVTCTAESESRAATATTSVTVGFPPATETPNAHVDLYVKQPWYPKNNKYVFVCDANDMDVNVHGYDWDFGDGEHLWDVGRENVFHAYDEAGTYSVTCGATGTNTDGDIVTVYDTIVIDVEEAPAVSVNVEEWYPLENNYSFVCENNFEADSFDWEMRLADSDYTPYLQHDVDDSRVFHSFQENGEYLISCTATNTETAQTLIDWMFIEVTGAPDTPEANPIEHPRNVVEPNGNAYVLHIEKNDYRDVFVKVPKQYAETRIDLSALQSGSQAFLPVTAVFDVEFAQGGAEVTVPAGITITADGAWDGQMVLPTLRSRDVPGKRVSKVIEVGSATDLTFDKGVRLLIEGASGEKVGFMKAGELTEITTACSEDTQTAADTLPAGGDCKITVGDDLVVWTKHFTEFVTYTDEPTRTSSGGGSSRGITSRGGGFNWFRSDDTVEEPEAPSEPAASERENRKPVIEIEDRPAAAAEPENRGRGNAITGNVAAEGAGSLGSWWLALVVALAVAALVVGAVLRRK